MKIPLTVLIAMVLATSVSAFDLGSRRPDKPVTQHGPSAPDPEVLRQGGDTFFDAVLVTLPIVNGTGATTGYADDYDEVCPFTNSTSPDVVYTFIPSRDMSIIVDMFGSAYDTKIYIYDENLALVACNDDFWSDYTSLLENVPVMMGVQYFLVIDGYGGDSGNYLLNISEFEPCEIECPDSHWCYREIENEPPLVDGYVDAYNGGCGSPDQGSPFSVLEARGCTIYCGVSGWFDVDGADHRDTDWFTTWIGDYGWTIIQIESEGEAYFFELAPLDCESVAVVGIVDVEPCQEAEMTLYGEPGEDRWVWFGPRSFDGPGGVDGEFDYYFFVTGGCVATEQHTLTEVKALFD